MRIGMIGIWEFPKIGGTLNSRIRLIRTPK